VPKLRLGVVLLVPPPAAAEVDGLRRAMGDRALDRIPPHITLVPPVNVNEERLDDALGAVRRAAAGARPLSLVLGPPATFLPVNPVLYLAVDGDTDRLADLRAAVFVPPLERSIDHPFVPHVTLADGAEVDRITDALVALSSYERVITVERIDILSMRPDRVWEPYADFPLARPAVVGRGGLPLELVVTDRVDPFAAAAAGLGRPFAITARRDGEVVGVAAGMTGREAATLHELSVTERVRHEGIGGRLLAAVESRAAERGCALLVSRPHPFLERHGWVDGVRLLGMDADQPGL
jgi:2'-5' RNA ligase